MAELLHYKRAANILGVTDKSMVDAIKSGRFETGVSKAVGTSSLPQYYVSDDDEGFLTVFESVQNHDPLPEFLIPRSQQPKRKSPKRAEPDPEPAEQPYMPMVSPEVRTAKAARAKITRDYGQKEGYRTKVYRMLDNGERSFSATKTGLIEPETLQDLYPMGGAFFLVIERRNERGEWEYQPNISRDIEPIHVDPKPGHVEEDDDLSHDNTPIQVEDARFVRGIAQSAVEEKMKSGNSGSLGEVAGVLGTLVQSQNSNFTQMMDNANAQHQRMLDIIREENKTERSRRQEEREDEKRRREYDLQMLEKRFELDSQRGESRHAKELERLRIEATESEKRTQTFIQAMQTLQNDHNLKRESIENLRTKILDDRVKETHEAVIEKVSSFKEQFIEKEQHLMEKFELMSSMAPGAMWTELFKSVGSQINLPGVIQAFQQAGAAAGQNPQGQIGQAAPKQIGGAVMGKTILEQIKSDPQGRDMLESLLKQMVQFVTEDEPPQMFAQNILSMIQSVPNFAVAWNEMYMTPFEKVWAGVIQPDTDDGKALAGEKGLAFWKAVRAYIKKAYMAM